MSDNYTLEQLPNEIFQELFEYFDTYELFQTFSQLNSRIDSLIKKFKYFQITLYSPADIDRRINRYFLSAAKTLVINHSMNFYDPIKFDLLSHIRCLILCQPTREQWNSIHPLRFPYLERLYLINSRFAYRTEQICRLIFTNEFHYLYSCSLPHISYEVNNQWTSSLSLRSLQISIWDIRVYTQILDTCPNLIRLKILLGGGTNQEKLLECNSNKKHPTLQYLIFYPSGPIICEFIDSILSFVSNLSYFSLNANHQRPSYVSLNTLASILECRTPKLNRINIDITLPDSLCCKEQIHTNYLLFKSYKIQPELNRSSRLIIVGSL